MQYEVKVRAMTAKTTKSSLTLMTLVAAGLVLLAACQEPAPRDTRPAAPSNETQANAPSCPPPTAPPPIRRSVPSKSVEPAAAPVHAQPKEPARELSWKDLADRVGSPARPEPTTPKEPVAEPAPVVPDKPSEPPRAAGDVKVVQSAVATSVEERMPQGVASRFSASVTQLWAWVKVSNATDAATKITMLWKRAGQVKSRVELRIGVSPGWRTWSRRRIGPRDTGSWTIEILDDKGGLLDKLSFEVGGGKVAAH